MIKIGELVKFDPFDGARCSGCSEVSVKLIGVVTFVHEGHRYFTAEYLDSDKNKQCISFRFDDIGKKVKPLIYDEDKDVSGLFEED